MLQIVLLLITAEWIAAWPAAGQNQEVRTFSSTFTTQSELDYLLYLPPDYATSDDSWPLVLFLHGAGERGSDVELVKKHGPPMLIAEGRDFPAIVVSPQCAQDSFWTEETDALLALLDELAEQYRVDPDRVYVTGLSMGGYGTWALTAAQPERFAAGAPICGGGFPIRARALTGLPIWAFHGDRDSVVPLSESTNMVNAIRRFGGHQVRLTVYPDTGHDSWIAAYADQDFWQWLFSQKRGQVVRAPNNPFGAARAREALEPFLAAWNAQDNAELRTTVHFPFLTFAPGGRAIVAESPEQFATDFAALRARGWRRSEFDWDSLEVVHTSAVKVHAAVDYHRYNQRDEVRSTGRMLYELTRQDEHWGMQGRIVLPRPSMTEAARTQAIEAARAVILDFFTGFNAGDGDRSTRTLNYPHTFLLPPRDDAPARIATTNDPSGAAPNFDAMRRNQGWHNSSIDSYEPVHVSQNQVAWKIVFSRWHPDGTRYLTVPALWVVTREAESGQGACSSVRCSQLPSKPPRSTTKSRRTYMAEHEELERCKNIADSVLDEHRKFVAKAGSRGYAADVGADQVLVGEGDSWFAYPGSNVLESLEWQFGYDVRSVAHNGDTLEDLVYDEKQLRKLTSKLLKLDKKGKKPKALLLSGGGNDIAGKELELLLNHASSGLAPVNAEILTGVLVRLEAAWERYFCVLSELTASIFGQATPMLIHGYDYPIPDGRGFWSGFWFLPGPWLRPSFRKKGYPADPKKLEPEKQVLKDLIEAYNYLLVRLSGLNDDVHLVEIPGTLKHGDNYDDDWRDELHPTDDGFMVVATKFHETLSAF